jgi:hypothetical protein
MKSNKINNNYHILAIVILTIMLILSILSFFKKDNARDLETTKVGGVENMDAVQELYTSDSYKEQQGAAIDQALAQINTEIDLGNKPTDIEENVE